MFDTKKRKITQTTMMDLSSELLEEILLRTPAKSLALMKLTCKQCKTLIEDPSFVSKHFSRSRGREQQQLTVIAEASLDSSSSKVSCMGLDFNRLRKPRLNVEVLAPVCPVEAVFECDGLLGWATKPHLLILNPLLRRVKLIELLPRPFGYEFSDYAYGLGYVTNSSYDYKVVKFSCDCNRKLDLWVYSFKSKSWSEVIDKRFDGFFNVPSSVCLKGTPYWVGIVKRGGTIYSIQSFDFERECFEPLSLPPTTFDGGDSLALGVFKVDYISLLHQSSLSGKIHLWVKKLQQWEMMMTVVIPELTMFRIFSSYLVENDSKLVITGSNFDTRSVTTTYVVGEDEEFQKVEYRCGRNSIIGGCYYVPSLLKVPGFSR